MRVTLLGSRKRSGLTDDFGDLFDSAARGVFDGFFIGGGQVDGDANVNLVGIGRYPNLDVRWPGSHGTPLLYMMIPNTIIFLGVEHTARALVRRVDFISAPGVSDPGVHRPGGPTGLVTSRCVFDFRAQGGFHLRWVHPGHTEAEVRANTGFDYEAPDSVAHTPLPSLETVALLREQVCADLAELYPYFAGLLADAAARGLCASAEAIPARRASDEDVKDV